MGIGTDLVYVPRLAAILVRQPGVVQRVYTAAEAAYCQAHRTPAPRFAGRFAAKEAVLKALGTGLARGMRWRDIEIAAGPRGAPEVRLHGAVAAWARAQGVRAVHVSISHHGDYALACAVTEPLSLPPADARGGPASD
jgi:holo-[acyl-carrier protein] synthase